MGKLVSCKTCKGQVDNTAKSCPHCGVSKPGDRPMSRNGQGCLIILMGVVLWIVISLPKTTPITTNKTPEELRSEQISRSFSGWNGEHKGLTKLLKSVLKDPDSYKHDKTTYVDMGDYLIVTTHYFAKNSFGALEKSIIIAKTTLNGEVIQIIKSE